jgi:hypothetical protein
MKHESSLSLDIMDSSLNVCLLCIILRNTHVDIMNEYKMIAWLRVGCLMYILFLHGLHKSPVSVILMVSRVRPSLVLEY